MTDRRKRVNRLKKIIIGTCITLLILPSIFCLLLLLRSNGMEKRLSVLEAGQQEMEQRLDELILIREEAVAAREALEASEANMTAQSLEQDTEEEAEETTVKKVYLTFDDGPGPYTEEILDILKRYNVKATFFVTAMNPSSYDQYYQRIVEDGHSIGIHTFSHVYSDIYSSLPAFQEDFKAMQEHIYDYTGVTANLYRFPGGSGNKVLTSGVRQDIMEWLESEGIQYYDWNVSGGDADATYVSSETITENCLNKIKTCNTAIVLLHDGAGKKSTVEALPHIIEGINLLGDTVLLPIDEETVPIQQISITKE